MKYTLFAGCSYTAGSGFTLEKQDPNLWVNLLHLKIFPHTTQLNVSVGGRSNAGIFQDTVKHLVSYPVETAVIQWTSMPRYELDLGLELYETRQMFTPNGVCFDHNLNNMHYSKKYLSSIRDRFTSLAHDFFEIVNLINYVNSIVKLAKLTNTRVFFINGLCPWDSGFFDKKTDVLPNYYTEYTQKLLNTNNRDDDEIYKLYNKMHNAFDAAGGINQKYWLNLYSSMLNSRTDRNLDGTHPGIQSNHQYVELFLNSIDSKHF